MNNRCYCIFCAILAGAIAILASFSQSSTRAEEPAAAEKPISFIHDVAPILKQNCFACHSAKQRKGRFDMSTFERMMLGGDKGEAVVAGSPDESYLWTLTSGTEFPRMPPTDTGDALSKAQIDIIEKWIEQGAKFDGESKTGDLLVELRKVWTPPTPPDAYEFPVAVRSLTFSPDGKKIVTGGFHEIFVYDIESGKLERRIHTRSERANDLLFLADGKTLAVAGGRPGQEGDVRLYDLSSDESIIDSAKPGQCCCTNELLQTDDEMLCLALSPDGKKLAAAGCDRIIRVWDVAQGFKLEQSIENHADWVFGLQFSPDNKSLFTCSRDKTAKMWDLEKQESIMTFPEHGEPVFGVAVRPDGKRAVSAGSDNQLRFWRTTGDGKQVRLSTGHTKTIWDVIYHPSEPIVISSSADHTVRIWNAGNAKEKHSLSGHTDWVYALALSPDGKRIASGAWNGEVRIWNLEDGAVVASFNVTPGK